MTLPTQPPEGNSSDVQGIVEVDATTSLKDNLYEIRPSPNKGLGVFARTHIPRGTLIMSEAPLFAVELPPVPPGQGHSVDRILGPISYAVDSLGEQDQSIFAECFEYVFPEEQEEEEEEMASQSASHHQNHQPDHSEAHNVEHDRNAQRTATRNMRIFRTNAYLIPSRSASSTPPESYTYIAPTVPAMFPKIARINHSCGPNAYGSWNPVHGHRVIRATRDIQPGEEVLVTYIPLLKGTQERRSALEQYGFRCDCEVCSAGDGDEEGMRAGRKEDVVRMRLGRELQELKGGWENRERLSTFQVKRFARQAGELAESLKKHDSQVLRGMGKKMSGGRVGIREKELVGGGSGGELWEYLEQVYDMAADFARGAGNEEEADRWAGMAAEMRKL